MVHDFELLSHEAKWRDTWGSLWSVVERGTTASQKEEVGVGRVGGRVARKSSSRRRCVMEGIVGCVRRGSER